MSKKVFDFKPKVELLYDFLARHSGKSLKVITSDGALALHSAETNELYFLGFREDVNEQRTDQTTRL